MRAYGLGPHRGGGRRPAASLRDHRKSPRGAFHAVDTIGVTGLQILDALIALGDSVTAAEFAVQTADADPAEIAGALDRMIDADLVARDVQGGVALTDVVREIRNDHTVSLADPHAMTSDSLATICRTLQIKAPGRKQERIDAIAKAFADPARAASIRNELSTSARELLELIASTAGAHPVDSDDLGLPGFQLRHAVVSSYGRRQLPSFAAASIGALSELVGRGIVGVAEWDEAIWIWREAWPLVDRPFHTDWPSVSRPVISAGTDDSPSRLPSIVGQFDQVMRAWESEPPPVLKTGGRRIGKTQVRATAKALGIDVDTVELCGRLAIGIELLLPNVMSESGRGRNRRVDQAFLADPALTEEWNRLDPSARWIRMIAEWSNPDETVKDETLLNRHLVLWELTSLEVGHAFTDAEAFGAWIAHRYGPAGDAAEVVSSLTDLSALGLIHGADRVALTPIARLVLDDPAAVFDIEIAESAAAIVQADLTVIAPPDLQHDLASRLAAYAEVESESGAVISRLSIDRITHAVQAGETADEVIAFLTELSSVPIADTVTRLVHDAAARAGRVRVISAPTVVIVSDPADLAVAISVKAAKLTKVSDTVAVSEVAHAKVRAALDRKGLAPELVVGAIAAGAATKVSGTSPAKIAADEAARVTAMAATSSNEMLRQHAARLTSHAERLADVTGRLSVQGPLALTPALVARLDGKKKKS